jgi:hypothetical protein
MCSLSDIYTPSRNATPQPKPIVSKKEDRKSSALPIKEFELLHHFSSVVSMTLGDDPPLQNMWRNDIPKEALRHEFLMYALLSMSALHIYSTDAGLRPRNEYEDDALHYYNIASTQFRQALEHVDETNKDSLFAASVLLNGFVLAFRIHACATDGTSCLDDISTFCTIGKGTRAIVESWHDSITPTIIHPLRGLNPWDDVVLPPDMQEAFATLSAYGATSTENQGQRAAYLKAINALEETYRALAANPRRPTLPFYWFVLIEKDFSTFIEHRDPTALVILAHHATLLNKYKQFWWTGNRGDLVLKEICGVLGTSHQDILSWPRTILKS